MITIEYTSGSAELIKMDEYLEWYQNITAEDSKNMKIKLLKTIGGTPQTQTAEKTAIQTMFSYSGDSNFETELAKSVSLVRNFISYGESFNIPFKVGKWIPHVFAYLYLGNPEKGIIVVDPEKYLRYIPERDYSGMTLGQVRAEARIGAGDSELLIVPRECYEMTTGSARAALDKKREEADRLKQRMQDVKDAKEESLAAIKAEIEAKQAELCAKQKP